MNSVERLSSERGAIFVQVGIALFVLVAFNVFVLDYGVMWTARRQAQNAADAGALAGAIARGYDDFDPTPSPSGEVAQFAKAVASASLVWNQPGTPIVSSFDCPAGVTGRCVRVDVYRDGTNASTALPTIFGPLLGVTSQGVRATATAVSGNGNQTNCLRPWAFADQWGQPDQQGNNQFNRYDPTDPTGIRLVMPRPDSYGTPGTLIDEFGQRIDFNLNSDASVDPITHGMLVPLDLHGGGAAVDYQNDIEACNGQLHAIGQRLPIMPSPGSLAGVNNTGVNAVIGQDPLATWDAFDNRVANSCAPGCGGVSPRLIPVVLFDPDEYQHGRITGTWPGCPGGAPCVRVANILGLFIHVGAAPNPHGHMVRYPGLTAVAAPTYADNASWLTTTTLIR